MPDNWRPLTKGALNSIIRRAKKEQVCEKGSPKTEIMEFCTPVDMLAYNPISHYLSNLPKWGTDRTILPVSSAVCPASPLSSRDFWLPGYARQWLIGCRWIRCTAMNVCQF